MTPEEFNKKYPVGTLVHYYPILDEVAHTVHKTRTEAQLNSQGQTVVWLSGIAGYVLLDHCAVIQKDIHDTLDWLVAYYITHTGKRPSESTIMELMEFSYKEFGNGKV